VVWQEVATPLVWLGPVVLVEAWAGCWSCTSRVFLKVGCSGTSSMVETVWVGWLSGG
jgi:hypothetical protein